ncbi:MAG: hypothetical protein ABSF70_10525 [Terracidiphilus sp.]
MIATDLGEQHATSIGENVNYLDKLMPEKRPIEALTRLFVIA